MRLDTLQQLRLEQRLAPKLIQAMEILQLPIMALEERISEELEKNPVLEVRENGIENSEHHSNESEQGVSENQDLVIDEQHGNAEDFSRLDSLDDVIDPDGFEQRTSPGRIRRYVDEDPKLEALANTADRGISLHEHLTVQWDLVEADPLIKKMGQIIIDNLEPDGYLKTDFSELARKSGLPEDVKLWEQALKEVQKLDPPGVAARDIKESLLLQLREFDETRALERQLIENFFDELQNHEYQKIAKETGESVERIKDAIEFIKKRLTLHPGTTFGDYQNNPIIPDIIVEYDEETGEYKIIVRDDNIPQLYIPVRYQKMLKQSNLDPKTREFIRRNIQSAKWIIEAIKQRQDTLRRVVECIVKAQQEFLEKGPKYLKPLPMAQIADQVGVHIATISRAVAGKYVQTPRGIYPLRFFFTGGTETENGESLSWDAIKEKIKELIENEDKTNPLSDDEIVKKLKEDGIDIARRTVAKYRKQMGIPSSHKRREK